MFAGARGGLIDGALVTRVAHGVQERDSSRDVLAVVESRLAHRFADEGASGAVQDRIDVVPLQKKIVEKPMQSIMIAAGVGFVLGVIMCRR